MNIERSDWSVVIAGYWNQAILTPAGIAYRLFKKPQDTPVQVEVPLDGLGPYRVRDDSVIIIAQPKRLHITADPPEYDNLQRALQIASVALNELPETPVIAAGFNFLYKIEDMPRIILKYLTSEIDEAISDSNYQITNRILKRSMNWLQGQLNLEITCDDKNLGRISLNFERQSSNVKELDEWVNTPIDTIKNAMQIIFDKVLMLSEESENEEFN